jgi:hypothetical protein
MKRKLFTAFFCGMALTTMFAFKTLYDAKKNTAEVEQYQGIYVFIDSKPINQYDYLGTVKNTMSLSGGQYEDVRDKLIKKTKSEFPGADAIILNLKSGGTDHADAVKLK